MLDTISSLERIMKCAPSAVLPRTRYIRDPSEWSARGSVLHAFLRDVNHLGREAALARVPIEHLEACEGLDLSRLPVDPEAYAAEVALAYDWAKDTGREINRGTDSRDYGASPTELAGRADVVALTPDAVKILDYKTGYRYLGKADESWQLKGYALAAARAYNRREAEVSFVRVTEDGSPWYISASLGYAELEETALAIAERAELIQRLRDEPALLDEHYVAGDHCRYCPAIGRCPERASILRRGFPELDSPDFVLNGDSAAQLLHRAKLVQGALDMVMERLDLFSDGEAIRVVDHPGLVRGPVSVAREEFDAVRGAAILGQRFGPEVATAAVDQRPKLTKASLERGLRVHMGQHRGTGLRIGKLKDDAIGALRDGGAAIVRRHTEYREHRPETAIEESTNASGE